MTTAGQNAAAGLGLSLILANLLNGPQRPALRSLVTAPPVTGGGGGGHGGWDPLGPLGPTIPKIPNVPGLPQGPITGLPFSPIAAAGGISAWTALLEVTGEFAFVAIAVLIAEDYPAPVVVFLAILWVLFLITRTAHPWRSQRAAAYAAESSKGA